MVGKRSLLLAELLIEAPSQMGKVKNLGECLCFFGY